MNKLSFFLKRPDINTPQRVYLYMRLNREQLKLYTSIKVLPKHWNPNRQRVKMSVANASVINDRLDRIIADVTAIVLSIENEHRIPTPELVKRRFELLYGVSRSATSKSVFDYWEDWLKVTEETKSTKTIKNYQAILIHLKAFCEDRGYKISFDGMDRHFVNSLTDYLLKVKEMTNSTLWNVFKTWKAFMKWAVELGITNNGIHNTITKKSFRVTEQRMLRLTETELQAIASVQLPEGSYLDNARNLFVLQCCLGVRFGDLERIVSHPKDYVDGNFIRLTTQKNSKSVMIPLLPIARQILVERVGEVRPVSQQKFNLYIKEVAEKAGLTDTIVKTEQRGAKKTQITVRKCDEIASHTAKRTFVSLMIARGISADVIMKITGNSRSTIDRYIILNEEDVEREMRKVADLLVPSAGDGQRPKKPSSGSTSGASDGGRVRENPESYGSSSLTWN